MIDIQEYLNAGFSPAQAQLLVARDQFQIASTESLREDVLRGFANTLAALNAGFNATDKRFDRIEQSLQRGTN